MRIFEARKDDRTTDQGGNSQETQFKMVWSTLYFEDTRWIKSIGEVKCCQPGSAVPFKYD